MIDDCRARVCDITFNVQYRRNRREEEEKDRGGHSYRLKRVLHTAEQ